MTQMTELENLTRCLHAAGYTKSQEGKERYTLYVDPEESFLQLQQWSGNSITNQELIVESVRPKSTAACLITPTGKFILCISPSSSLDAYTYDEGGHRWVRFDEDDIGDLSRSVVHPDGKLASSVDSKGIIHGVFQDQSRRLVYFSNSSSTTLPVNPVPGSPLSISTIRNTLHIFYISAKDNFIHDVTRANDSWKDAIGIQHAFVAKPKNVIITANESKNMELYVMTQDDEILKNNSKGRLTKLGTVKMGNFIPERISDFCTKDAWDGTLTEDKLKSYLAEDPFCIDIPGSEHSVTPLAAACIRGHLDVVRLLLQYRANPNALSTKRRTPLFYATSAIEVRDRCAIVRALLEARANVDECYAENGFNTPLINAITLLSDQDVVNELLNHGASPTANDVAGHSVALLAKGTPMEAVVSEGLEQARSDGQTAGSTSAKRLPIKLRSLFPEFKQQPSSAPVSPVKRAMATLAQGVSRMSGGFQQAPSVGHNKAVNPVVSERRPSIASAPPPHTAIAPAHGVPMEAVASERIDIDQINLSPFEGRIVEFVVALMIFIVAYTNSPRVKQLMDQVVIGLRSEMNDADGESPPESSAPSEYPVGASSARRQGGSAGGWATSARYP
ncbi:hypothetical protein M413DRAFT_6656 [Hebeloma cylindrosporum]|uniref:Uncharacterized protein n=1 Tax=Hebeloma cylindrosporum TaxID=76867 RepID=A0A0C3D014_HEBCY|nr:hypothetical protein M413DRAFT_6656 [Hebeloma cylindrosporum h7]